MRKLMTEDELLADLKKNIPNLLGKSPASRTDII